MVMAIQTPKDLAEWVDKTVHKWPVKTYHLMPKSALKQINIQINVRSLRPETEKLTAMFNDVLKSEILPVLNLFFT